MSPNVIYVRLQSCTMNPKHMGQYSNIEFAIGNYSIHAIS